MKRYELLNHLISTRGYKTYLEIGVAQGKSFKHIKAPKKESVDIAFKADYQMSSDCFFVCIPKDQKYDLIFIDGLHQDEQVRKDLKNSLQHLNEGGTIVVHDCNPAKEEHQIEDKPIPSRGPWNGTVWKAILRLRLNKTDLTIRTVDTDYGCCVIQRGQQEKFVMPAGYKNNYRLLEDYRKAVLNLITVEEFLELYK